MATTSSNSFISYNFSEREKAESLTFNDIQIRGIMNERANIAQQLIALDFDPANPIDFGIQQSFLRGQMTAFDYLLNANEEAHSALLELAKRESQSQ